MSSPDSPGSSQETAVAARRSGCGNPRRREGEVPAPRVVAVRSVWTGADADRRGSEEAQVAAGVGVSTDARETPGESWLGPLPAAVGQRSSLPPKCQITGCPSLEDEQIIES